MPYLINANEQRSIHSKHKDKFEERYIPLSEILGAKGLGYNISIVPPGKAACPFHNHHINEEMFFILEGEGTLRFGQERKNIKALDVICALPGDQSLAHQIINTGTKDLKYLSVSTMFPADICEYPDSNKILMLAGKAPGEANKPASIRHITMKQDSVDYFAGED